MRTEGADIGARVADRTRIKICGITRLDDALAASHLGVDAVGFVFYARSPRYIAPIKAGRIIRELPPFVSAVGLFVNPTQDEIDRVLDCCALGVIQLHGDETPEFCDAQPRRVIKAVAVESEGDLKRARQYPCAVLLDAKAPAGVHGGTGRAFDWDLVRGFAHDFPVILAGGLDAGNVGRALAVRDWFAVDVASGVESSPGVKDVNKMRAFVHAVAQADAARRQADKE